MTESEQNQLLYHLNKTMESQSEVLKEVQSNVHKIQIDVEVMKKTGAIPEVAIDHKKERLRDSATGGSLGAVLMTIILSIYEYLKS